MARKPSTNPRKPASQERSRLTVDALLEATARVVIKEGYDRASTNKIAAVAGVSIGSLNRKLHRVLAEQTPRTGRLENIEAMEREAYALVRGYLEAHRDELDIADPDVAAFVCVTAVEALTHAAVVRPSESITDEKAERLVDDVTRLVVRYLRKS